MIKHVKLERRAFEDVEYLRLDENPTVEVSAGLFGRVCEANNKIVICEIRANINPGVDKYSPNECGMDVEAWKIFDREEARLVGSAHSHPGDDRTPSDADLTIWEDSARALGHPFVGVIFTRGEIWEGGFPLMSWTEPVIDAWVVEPSGARTTATITITPQWLDDLELKIRRPEEEPRCA